MKLLFFPVHLALYSVAALVALGLGICEAGATIVQWFKDRWQEN